MPIVIVRPLFALIFLGFWVSSPPCSAYIGGAEARPGEFPSTLWIENGCTGSLISPTKILLSGHCILAFKNDPNHFVGQPLRIHTQVVAEVHRAIATTIVDIDIHPAWLNTIDKFGEVPSSIFSYSQTLDIAIIEVDKNLLEEDSRLEVAALAFSPLRIGHELMVGGYGCEEVQAPSRKPRLKMATKKIMRIQGCMALLSHVNSDGQSQSMGCEGDSGGPAYMWSKGRLVQVGVNTLVRGSERGGTMGVLDLSRVETWVKSRLDLSSKRKAPYQSL